MITRDSEREAETADTKPRTVKNGTGVESSIKKTVTTDGVASAKEVGGRDGPDPTRYGDWEKGGRCIDF